MFSSGVSMKGAVPFVHESGSGSERMVVALSGWGSASSSLRCSDAVGRVTGRASGLEKPVPFVPKGSVPAQVRRKAEGERANSGSAGKS